MCSIVGYTGSRPAGPIVIEGLKQLEYRGYDSAGIAILQPDGHLALHKSVGKLSRLLSSLNGMPQGCVGVGHTRWATHGKPTLDNAHPHVDCSKSLVVTHNGIVENYLELKKELIAEGHKFSSQTDSEVIPHLIENYQAKGMPLEEAVRLAASRLAGAHAIVVMSCKEPGKLVGLRLGNAGGLVLGYGEGEVFMASGLPGLLSYTDRVVFLSSGEIATADPQGLHYFTLQGKSLAKEPQTVPFDPASVAKGGYKHFMLKEIMEQPESLVNTIRGRLEFEPPGITLEQFPFSTEQLRNLDRVVLVGMGTSLHAAQVGRLMIEDLAGIPAEVDNASEFRYRNPIIGPATLVVSVSQSGETADTLAAMEEAKRKKARQVTICNVVGSQATRMADYTLNIRAGMEMGVASTKTFTSSVTALYLLAAYLGQARGVLKEARLSSCIEDLARTPQLVGRALANSKQCEALASRYYRLSNFLFLGRGVNYPTALEGALKLKEVSYIHAEGYAAGEMKHGPIALIDENMPTVAIALKDKLREKMLSNIEEVKARNGRVIALVTEGDTDVPTKADEALYVPEAPLLLSPIVAVVPLQLFAYHIAVRRGCDVDQPRNLAKSVTVE